MPSGSSGTLLRKESKTMELKDYSNWDGWG